MAPEQRPQKTAGPDEKNDEQRSPIVLTEKELKKLFKSKLSHQHFEFNPQNWAAMEAVLDQPKKKAGAYWWQSAAILVFGLAAGLSLLTRDSQSNLPLPQDNVVVEPRQSPAPLNEGTAQTESQSIAEEHAVAERENSDPSAADRNQSETGSSRAPGNNQLASNPPKTLSRESYSPFQPDKKSFARSSNSQTGLEPFNFTYPEIPTADLASFEPEALPKFDNRHEVSVQGGPSVNSSYAGAAGAGWNIGLMYRYRVSPRVSLSTGALYNRTGDVGISTATDSVFFGFGRTEVHTEKAYKNISSMRFPLELEYHLSPAHTVSAGGYAEVVTSVQMDMERTTTAFKADPVTESHSNSQKRKEFNNFNAGLRVGYTYRINPQFSLGLNLNYGLTDLTNDRYKGFTKDHRLMQTEVVVRYRLF